MLFSKVLAALAATTAVSAHTWIWQVSGSTSGLRPIKNGSEYRGNPIQDVSSSSMRCNVGGGSAVTPRNVSPGQQLYFEYAHNTPGPQDDILDPSHIGPCMIYAARGPQATDWVKLWHDGYSGGQWCTIKMIRNRGIYFTIPSNMPSGHWVLRVEVLALHSAYTVGEAQFYMACMDINVSGSNSGTPSPIVRFPGAYSSTEAGVKFNVWTSSYPNPPNGQYPIPGGSVGGFSGSSGGNTGGNNGGQQTTTTQVRTTTQAPRTTTQGNNNNSGGSGSPLYGQW